MELASDEESDLGSGISDWEIEEGLPQPEDPFIQQYHQGREALIEQEKSQRSDNAFRQSLTPLAIEACTIVSNILAEERATVWTNEFRDDLERKDGINIYPGMMFTLARETMAKTKSWQIVRKLPKGALLHAHMDATIDVDWLIEHALATEGMAMSATAALWDPSPSEDIEVSFRFRKDLTAPAGSIWTKAYSTSQFVPLKEAAESFPKGGKKGFKVWLKRQCTITPEEALLHHHGIDAIWRKFSGCFRSLNSLEYYEPIFRPAIRRLLHDVVEDGIKWVDFRSMFAVDFFLEGQEEPIPDSTHFLRIWTEELEAFKASDEGRHFWGCRFIWTSLRYWGKKQIIEHMKQCIAMKLKFPDLICGYDLVGQEDMGRTLSDLTPELFWFKKKCMESGVEIPFFFHAGECIGDGDGTDTNLFDAILLGTRRIGHGFSLYKHPLLTEQVKTRKILVESCPISNEVLRLTSSVKSHPLPALLARGVPCCLSNDDPGILGYGGSGVSQDFWQALQGWENLGLEGLGSLAENSVRWAAYAPDLNAREWKKEVGDGVHGQGVRAERMREWRGEWDRFCEWVVREFAIDYGGDQEF